MRAEKTQIVDDIAGMLGGAKFIFMLSYKGLKVKDISEFRRVLSKNRAECKVLKNRLVRKAASNLGIEALGNLKLSGDTAFVFGQGDAGGTAKAIMDFVKTHESVAPKAGFMDCKIMTAEDIRIVSELPPIEVLRAQLLGLLLAPARNLVTVLNAKASEIVNVLNAYKNKLENK